MKSTLDHSAPDIDASAAQIGVIGNNAIVSGGIHFYTCPPHNLDLLPFNLRTNIRNFLTNYLGTEDDPVPFGGRKDELARLERWRTQSQKRFLLLATPAGRGKSALLSRWADMLSQRDFSKTVAVIFVPISSRFNTNLPELIFPCIAVQLAPLFGEGIPTDYLNMPPSFWQSLVGEYLRRSLPDGRSILLIIDGLDEAAWDINPSLFPHELPLTTRVVVSARYLAGDSPGPDSWFGRLGWERFKLAEAFTLENLTRDGVRDLLGNLKQPLAASPGHKEILDQLYSLTSGDPLLVELYVRWLDEQNESIRLRPEDLARIEPDYKGFFEYWWQAQEQLWVQTNQTNPMERESVRTLLSIFATALGPLSIGDIRDLVPGKIFTSKYAIREALKPLRRFVIGEGEEVGFSFSHPRLADYFREEFLYDHERRNWQATFVEWGNVVIDRLQKTDDANFQASPYLLQYFSRHLHIAKEPVESFFPLLSQEWMQSWYRYTEFYAGFLRDVDLIWERLISVDQKAVAEGALAPYAHLEIKCALCYSSVSSLSGNIPTDLLVAMRRYGKWTDVQAIHYARQKPDIYQRSVALLKIAPHLDYSLQQEVLKEAFRTACAVRDEGIRARLLCRLAAYLPEDVYEAAKIIRANSHKARVLSAIAPHLPEEVYQVALAIQSERAQAWVLSSLASHLPEQVYQSAQRIRSHTHRAEVLSKLIPYLPTELQTKATQKALRITRAIQDEEDRAWLLRELSSYMPKEVFRLTKGIETEEYRAGILSRLVPYFPQKAYKAALELQDERYRAGILSRLIPYLPKKVHKAALAIKIPSTRALVLSRLISYLPEAAREDVFGQVLETVQTIRDESFRAGLLNQLAPYLPEEMRITVLQEALWATKAIKNQEARAQILIQLVSRLTGELQALAGQEALQAIQDIRDRKRQAEYLSQLAPYLPEVVRKPILQKALENALSIQDEGSRAVVLSRVANFLPNQVYEAALAIQEEHSWVDILTALAPSLPEKVFHATMAIRDVDYRTALLSGLAPYLPEQVYKATLTTTYSDYRLTALLIALAPYVPEQVYERAKAIKDPECCASIISKLAPYLSEVVRKEALRIAIRKVQSKPVRDEWTRARALMQLAPHTAKTVYESVRTIRNLSPTVAVFGSLAPYLPEEVFQAALTIWSESYRVVLFKQLARHLPEKVFEVAMAIKNRERQAEVLSLLAPYLPEKVCEVAIVIDNEGHKAKLLRHLAPFLPEAVYRATAVIHSIRYRAEVLNALAPYLPIKVFQATEEFQNPQYRGRILSRLIAHLPEPMRTDALHEAINAVRVINAPGTRAHILGELVPYLPKEERKEIVQQAMSSAQSVRNENHQTRLLIELMPHSPEQVCTAAHNLENIRNRRSIVSTVSEHMTTWPANRSYSVWLANICALKRYGRPEALEISAELVPLINNLGGGAALEQMLQVVEDVSSWWP